MTAQRQISEAEQSPQTQVSRLVFNSLQRHSTEKEKYFQKHIHMEKKNLIP